MYMNKLTIYCSSSSQVREGLRDITDSNSWKAMSNRLGLRFFLSFPACLRKYFCAWLATCVGVLVVTKFFEIPLQSPFPRFLKPFKKILCSSSVQGFPEQKQNSQMCYSIIYKTFQKHGILDNFFLDWPVSGSILVYAFIQSVSILKIIKTTRININSMVDNDDQVP